MRDPHGVLVTEVIKGADLSRNLAGGWLPVVFSPKTEDQTRCPVGRKLVDTVMAEVETTVNRLFCFSSERLLFLRISPRSEDPT